VKKTCCYTRAIYTYGQGHVLTGLVRLYVLPGCSTQVYYSTPVSYPSTTMFVPLEVFSGRRRTSYHAHIWCT
jgi:hypothetical protein